jgi:hypothetical protein
LGEAFKTSYCEYVENRREKDMAVYDVRDAVARLEYVQSLSTPSRAAFSTSPMLACRNWRGMWRKPDLPYLKHGDNLVG